MPLLSRRKDSLEPREGSNTSTGDHDSEPEKVFTVDDAIESHTVEAFEVMLLAIFSAVLKCEWGLSSYQEAAITSFVFVGFVIGCLLWGTFADKYGRKKALMLVCATSAVFGILSAFSPNFYWMVFLQMLLGVAGGGRGQGVTFCIEFLPSKMRGIGVLLIEVFWVFGTIGIVSIGWATVPTLGWPWMLIFAALPVVVMTFVIPFMPQSPRFLILHSQADKAFSVLNLVARINCKPRLNGHLVTVEEKERMQRDGELHDSNAKGQADGGQEDGKDIQKLDPSTPLLPSKGNSKWKNYFFMYLFKNGMWKTTFLLWPIWLHFVFYYYGMILLTTTIFQYDKHCKVPGIFVTMLILTFIGRKLVIGIEMLVATLFTGLLFLCIQEIWLTVFLFVCRALIAGAFQALYVYTPEVYPTRVLFPASDIAGITVFMVIPLVSAIAVFILPIETRGRKLKDTGEAVH